MRAKLNAKVLREKLKGYYFELAIYGVVIFALLAVLCVVPSVLPLDDRIERVSKILTVLVKLFTAVSLVLAIIYAPPFFKDTIAKEYLKDSVKAMQRADTKVLKETISLLEKLNNPNLEGGIVRKSDIVYFKDALGEMRMVALEGKPQVLTLVTLMFRMLKFLEAEYDPNYRNSKLSTADFINCLCLILEYLAFVSSSVINLPKSSAIKRQPIANLPLKYVENDTYETFKGFHRGLNMSSDSATPLMFFDLMNSAGSVHLCRASALGLSPAPFYLRILDIHQMYIPPHIVNPAIKTMDGGLTPLKLVGWCYVIKRKEDVEKKYIKVWYSNLDRFYLLLTNPKDKFLDHPFKDAVLNQGFFDEVEMQQDVKITIKETIEMVFLKEDLESYYRKHKQFIQIAILKIDELMRAGKQIGDKI